MNHLNNKILNIKSLIFSLLFLFTSGSLYADIKVVSPQEGIWSNKQMLVIDTEGSNDDYFYSLNGSDPENFGFFYDGPVLIDLSGDVQLRIKKAGKNNETEEAVVKYSVIPDNVNSKPYSEFINTFYKSGVINYSAGSILSIPSELEYSLSAAPYNYIQGQDLTISEKCVLTRYIPCVIRDPATGKRWSFIIKTFPQTAGVFSRRDVPFKISNWENLTFTNKNFIYKIDSEFWGQPKESIKIDRNESHMIYWQSIDYSPDNPIEFFVLPPKPQISASKMDDGSVVMSIDGDDSYSLSVLSFDEKVYQELFEEICADTFYGDRLKGQLKVGVFSNSVYQGELLFNYFVNKRPPAQPVITSSSKDFYSRGSVSVNITSEEGCDLFYAISKPYLITDSKKSFSADSSVFKEIETAPFEKCGGSSVKFTLNGSDEGAVYYKIRAYSGDGKNQGKTAEYGVVIDNYNYYYNEASTIYPADGSIGRPYNNFKECIESANKVRNARLYITGPVTIPEGQTVITSNIEFTNQENGELNFKPDATLYVKNSTVQLENFKISADSTKSSSTKIVPLFKLENAVMDISNCQISALLGKNGTFADCFNTSILMNSTIASVNASTYASFLSGVKTRLNIQNSSINVTADTAVVLSMNEGNISVRNNSFKVIGTKGRIAELFDIKGNFTNNILRGNLKSTSPVAPVYKDKQTSISESKNDQKGFNSGV